MNHYTDNIYINIISKQKKVNKDNTPPEGWTEEAKEGARIAASIGHELSDFSDSGDDLEELADIMNLDSPRYDNLKKKG